MNTPEFVEPDFTPPLEARVSNYLLRPLVPQDVEADCAAVNASVELIRQTRGGTWPRGPITVEEDLGDLREHERLFQANEAFAYTIVDQLTAECAGCFYLYPPHHPLDDTDQTDLKTDADAVVSFWVTPEAYQDGLYVALFPFTEAWLRSAWPFHSPYIVNREKPAVS